MRAMFLPTSRGRSWPPYLAALRSAASRSRKRSSSGLKSSSLRKLRFRRLNAMTIPSLGAGRRGLVWAGDASSVALPEDELDQFLDDHQADREPDADGPLGEVELDGVEDLLEEADRGHRDDGQERDPVATQLGRSRQRRPAEDGAVLVAGEQ